MIPEPLKLELKSNFDTIKKSTPRIFFSRKQLEFNYQFFKETLNLRNQQVFYSVKTNYENAVIETLNNLGSNFEIASLGELNLMKANFIAPQRLIFSNPVKIPQHLKEAYDYGVRLFAFDTESELVKISTLAPNSEVFLRLSIENEGSEWKLEHKFGATKDIVLTLLQKAESMGLKPSGISVHVGWNNKKVESWERVFALVFDLLEEIKASGLYLKFLNLGGGFPAHRVDQYRLLSSIAKISLPFIYRLKKEYEIEIITEPGSFMVANTAVLATQIYDIIQRDDKWLFLDSGIMQGFPWILSNLEYNIFHSDCLEFSENDTTEFIITGPTLDSHDVFSPKGKLPVSTKIGDILFIHPAGAYINSSVKYNHFETPALEVLEH